MTTETHVRRLVDPVRARKLPGNIPEKKCSQGKGNQSTDSVVNNPESENQLVTILDPTVSHVR